MAVPAKLVNSSSLEGEELQHALGTPIKNETDSCVSTSGQADVASTDSFQQGDGLTRTSPSISKRVSRSIHAARSPAMTDHVGNPRSRVWSDIWRKGAKTKASLDIADIIFNKFGCGFCGLPLQYSFELIQHSL